VTRDHGFDLDTAEGPSDPWPVVFVFEHVPHARIRAEQDPEFPVGMVFFTQGTDFGTGHLGVETEDLDVGCGQEEGLVAAGKEEGGLTGEAGGGRISCQFLGIGITHHATNQRQSFLGSSVDHGPEVVFGGEKVLVVGSIHDSLRGAMLCEEIHSWLV